MRVAIVAAGAGGMYCGSCLRDNRLGATLIEQGRDVMLVPLYTPLRTDETDVSGTGVAFGGVNAYLSQRFRSFRWVPNWFRRILDARPILRWASRVAGSTSAADLGELTVSVLTGIEGPQASEVRRFIERLRSITPDVVHLPNLMFVGFAEPIKKALGAKVVCSLSGEDIFLDALLKPHRSTCFELIRRFAPNIDLFISPTKYYAGHCASHFSLDSNRIRTVTMGIRASDFSMASPPSEPFTVGYLARICPEKGLHNVGRAVASLSRQGHSIRLRAAGYLGPLDRGYLDRVISEIAKLVRKPGVFEYLGAPDRTGKIEFLKGLHVFSVPTDYPEAKGLYLLEAMASGVPVIQPDHGSFSELISASVGGVTYDRREDGALERALLRMMQHPEERLALGKAGREAVQSGMTDVVMAHETWDEYKRIVNGEKTC